MGPDDSSSAFIWLMENSHIPLRCPLSVWQLTQIPFLYSFSERPRRLVCPLPKQVSSQTTESQTLPILEPFWIACSHLPFSSTRKSCFIFSIHKNLKDFKSKSNIPWLRSPGFWYKDVFFHVLVWKCLLKKKSWFLTGSLEFHHC